jgi:CRP/FNR family cyclic AMP-dependent transcriptional regulator
MQIFSELSTPFVTACGKVDSAAARDIKSKSPIYLRRPLGTTWVVKRGYVRLAFVEPDGSALTRMLLGKGAMFGDLPFTPGFFLSNERAIASGMSCVIQVSRQELEKQAVASSTFESLMLQTFSAQLQALDRRMQWQLISPLRTRIATALHDLICFSGGRCGHGHLVDVRLTHEEFAELVVATRPAVSEVLVQLKQEGIIDYTRSYICLLSLDRLLSMSAAEH